MVSPNQGQVNHSTVAIQELMHAIGVPDAGDPRTAAAVDAVTDQITAMSVHRVFMPDADALGRAALLAEFDFLVQLAPAGRVLFYRAGD